MAKTPESILGAFIGTIEPLPGYIINGQNILHSGTSKLNLRRTTSKMVQLEKIRVCNRFTKAFSGTGLFNKSFPSYGSKASGYERATSTLMNQALVGRYPNINLSYSKVMVSKGKLSPAKHAAAVPMEDGNIYFSFTDNSSTGNASSFDRIILVAYFEELQQAVFSLNAGSRSDCEAVLQTSLLKGYVAETWIGFLSIDETNASNSVYTGRVQL